MPDAVLLPKVEDVSMVQRAFAALEGAPTAIWVMVETPLGVLRAESLAASPLVGCLVAGTNDLAADRRCDGAWAERAAVTVAGHVEEATEWYLSSFWLRLAGVTLWGCYIISGRRRAIAGGRGRLDARRLRHVEAGGAEQGKADAKSAKAGGSVDGERCHRIVDDRRVQPVHERPRTCCARVVSGWRSSC